MADFDSFTDVTSLLSTDSFLGTRSASGINFTLATLAAAAGKLLGDGTVSLPGVAFASDPDTGMYRPSANTLAWALAGTERMRLTGGVLLIGHSSAIPAGGVSGYLLQSHATSTSGAVFGRWTADTSGPSVVLAKSRSATIGAFSAAQSGDQLGVIRFYGDDGTDLATEAVRIQAFANGAVSSGIVPGGLLVYVCNAAGVTTEAARLTDAYFRAGVDNAMTLGGSSNRFTTVYATTGTINTSDERDKVWIGFREDARALWARIARRVFDDLGWYQWRDAVAEKGADGARWHFGARAQQVWAIVAEEGFAPPLTGKGDAQRPDPAWQGPPPPAFLCFDAWDKETQQQDVFSAKLLNAEGNPIKTGTKTVVTREAGNRFGFRIDQLGLLLDWSLHQRLAALEAA